MRRNSAFRNEIEGRSLLLPYLRGDFICEKFDEGKGAGLASQHSKLGVTCLDCHEADLKSQVSEATAQLTGSYSMEDLELGSTYYVDNDKCLSCHGSWNELAEKTADLGDYNPHDSIHGTIEYCGECHKGHAEQVDICGECHPNGGQKMKA